MNEKQTYVNREYKDSVFRILYRDDKKRQLELYNAVSGRNYTDSSALQVVTLKHAIYMGMKNDLAFIVSDDLHLYEHQSTVNPNMPLRFLHYISKEYEGLVEGSRLYGSTKISLQAPYFTVFYNGTASYPERRILRLSDLYQRQEAGRNPDSVNDRTVDGILKREYPLLELKVMVININPGCNADFLENCPSLREYMKYVERVRNYNQDLDLKDAVNRAVDDCIRDGILEDFLRKNKAEVVAMSIFEYDEEKVIDYIRKEERETGREEGREEEAGRFGTLIIKLTEDKRDDLIIKIASNGALRERLYEEYHL